MRQALVETMQATLHDVKPAAVQLNGPQCIKFDGRPFFLHVKREDPLHEAGTENGGSSARPCLVMVNESPSRTRSSSSPNLVFASRAPTRLEEGITSLI
jgi:hypothetical protein